MYHRDVQAPQERPQIMEAADLLFHMAVSMQSIRIQDAGTKAGTTTVLVHFRGVTKEWMVNED